MGDADQRARQIERLSISTNVASLDCALPQAGPMICFVAL
jgi:hypothetical protein